MGCVQKDGSVLRAMENECCAIGENRNILLYATCNSLGVRIYLGKICGFEMVCGGAIVFLRVGFFVDTCFWNDVLFVTSRDCSRMCRKRFENVYLGLLCSWTSSKLHSAQHGRCACTSLIRVC